MGWTKVLAEVDLAEGQRQVVTVDGTKVLVLKHEGTIHAVNNACPHLKLSMKKGKIVDGAIVCPWHRSVFDLQSGEVKDWTPFPPGVGKLMGMMGSQKSLTIFPTKVEEGNIWVEI
ncbi:MAG: Rieske (2Fe-2S) protein [Leptolyngbyaceae bacterium]|nr:Rieske (2Fe-2S) protein [Leptolyngbyaceae bacterium]